MPYRADEEAHRAQRATLEARIAELEAQNLRLLAGERPPETLFGVALTVASESELPLALSRSTSKRVLELADEVLGSAGQHSVADTLALWRADDRDLEVYLRRANGKTSLRVVERIGLVTGAMVGGILGGAGGVVLVALALFLRESRTLELLLVVTPVLVAVLFAVARFVLWWRVRSARRKVDSYALTLEGRIRKLAANVAPPPNAEEPS